MLHYIYGIRNKINNKYYIGLTNNPRRRRNRHFTDLRCNRHDNRYLQQAFNEIKNKTTSRLGERIFTKDQVFIILSILEFGYRKIKPMARKLKVAEYTIACIRDNLTYKYEKNLYDKLSLEERYNLRQSIKIFWIQCILMQKCMLNNSSNCWKPLKATKTTT